MSADDTSAGGAAAVVGRAWLVALIAITLVAILAMLGTTLATRPTGNGRMAANTATMMPMPSAAGTLELESVPADMAATYRYVAAHAADFSQVPCYCGCEQSFGHRNLADCFVRADGQGFDSHAAGCAVCLGEAAVTRGLLDNGLPPSAAADAVTRQYGTTAPTTPDATVPPTSEASA